MARVLLLQPNRWGRGVTSIWIPAHTASLRQAGHEVRLFDATFFTGWSQNETRFNTLNKQYRPTDYESHLRWRDDDVRTALQRELDTFDPDVVFGSALSSHIHGEGEYVNVQYAHELLEGLTTRALRVAGGLQVTAAPAQALERYPVYDVLITGESDLVLPELATLAAAANNPRDPGAWPQVAGLCWRDAAAPHGFTRSERQPILHDLDAIPPYDYSVFDDQVFLRPYQGQVLRGIDYELSRGCMYTCAYCVETVIQGYYGFDQVAEKSGALVDAKRYLRHKSAARIHQELRTLRDRLGIDLIRCQDTNFLSIHRPTLLELAERLERDPIDVRLYVETRVDRMARGDFDLLERLGVAGVGTGIEVSNEAFREDHLQRFAATDRLAAHFEELRRRGIQRTAYNIIGLPDETEAMILDTIELNRQLDPDNITVAFYSPYAGTPSAAAAEARGDFDPFTSDVDGQLRTRSHSGLVDQATLAFYKAHFTDLVRDGLDGLDDLKRAAGLLTGSIA